MPTTYTHYRFGHDVLKHCDSQIQLLINRNLDLFHVGLHGPDILFYYKPFSRNYINTLGTHLHHETGRSFFENAGAIVKKRGYQEADLAYLYGFICHFALDSVCHGFVIEYEKVVTHSEIEAEFDRYLLVQDHLDPLNTLLTHHLHPDAVDCSVIARYFPGVTVEDVHQSLKQMVMFLNMIATPSHSLRRLYLTALKLTGSYDSMHGLFINYEPNPDCILSNEKLIKLYQEAIDVGVRLIDNYVSSIENQLFDLQYDYDFEGQDHREDL
ncbi:MAG: zinc dependent phospholipase C family protein [bacterium]